MNDRILRLYHSMPPLFRTAAATLRGLYLRSWRFGPETDRLVEEAIERETWDERQWKAWRENRLGQVLWRAANRVPYYRNQWRMRRSRGDQSSWEYLENWPVLEKDQLREVPMMFVADDSSPRRMFHDHTSGTSGKPLNLWVSKEGVREWYALVEARMKLWYGVSRHDRWAILGGQLVTPVDTRRPPFWTRNAAMNQLYMSSYHLAPDLLRFYIDALRKYKVRYMLGYTSSLHQLAGEITRSGVTDLRMAVVITNAEPVFEYQRAVISEAFHCPVRETYGMAEIVTGASECHYGRLHLWPEAGITEVIEDGRPVPEGSAGELVCTGLLNPGMPLIRYRIGDRVAMKADRSTCPCGRTLPVLDCVEGRNDDLLYTRDGRRVGRLDTVFKADLNIREAQIVQENLGRLVVKVVPAPGFGPHDSEDIVARLKDRMGADTDIVVQPVDAIPRTKAGKFRSVICAFSPQTHVSV